MKMVKRLQKTENAQKLTFDLQHLLLALVALLASMISPCLSLGFLQTSTISLSRLSSSAQSFAITTAVLSTPTWSCLSRELLDEAKAEISNEIEEEHGLGYTLGGYRGFRGYFDKREAGAEAIYKNDHVDKKAIYTADAEPGHTSGAEPYYGYGDWLDAGWFV